MCYLSGFDRRGRNISFLDQFFACIGLLSKEVGLNVLFWGRFLLGWRRSAPIVPTVAFIASTACLLRSVLGEWIELLLAWPSTFDGCIPRCWGYADLLKRYGVKWLRPLNWRLVCP